MKLIEKTRYRIQYVGKDETYAPLVGYLESIQSREYTKKEDAEHWRRSYINSERWSFYESDFILVPVRATYVKDSFAARYLKALKEQVKTNDAAATLMMLAVLIAVASTIAGLLVVLFPALAEGQSTSSVFAIILGVFALFSGTAVFVWTVGALLDMDRREGMQLPV